MKERNLARGVAFSVALLLVAVLSSSPAARPNHAYAFGGGLFQDEAAGQQLLPRGVPHQQSQTTDTPTPPLTETVAGQTATPSETPTFEETPTPEPSATATATPSPGATETAAPSPTISPSETLTPTPTETPSPMPTGTATPTPEPLEPITLMEPSGSISAAQPTYRWQELSSATRYQLLVEGAQGVVHQAWYEASDICVEVVCEVTLDTPLSEGDYTWQVQAGSQDMEGPWSEPLAFTVAPATPELEVEVSAPEHLVAGGTAIVTVTVRNVGVVEATEVRFRDALPEGLYPVLGANSPGAANANSSRVDRQPGSDDLVADLGALPAGESVSLSYQISAYEPAEGPVAVTDVVQVSAAGLDAPVVAEATVIVVATDSDWAALQPEAATVVHGERASVEIPAGAYAGGGGMALIHRGEEHAQAARSEGLLAQFDVVILSDPGIQRPPLPEAAREALERAHQEQGQGAAHDPERPDAALHRVLDERRPLVERPEELNTPAKLTVRFDGLTDLSGLWAD